MKPILGISVFTFLLVVSCQGQQKKGISRIDELSKEYVDAKNKFDTVYVSHFPNKEEIDSSFSYSYYEIKEWGIIASFSIINGERKRINNLLTKAIAIYPANDTCQLVVNRFFVANKYRVELMHKDSSLIDRFCYNTRLPVPNFRNTIYTSSQTSCKLPPDFTLYVLGAESGIFFQPEDKYPPNKYMPKTWKHGYSKGIAISKKMSIAIYWIIVW